jgi:O-methyltransferase
MRRVARRVIRLLVEKAGYTINARTKTGCPPDFSPEAISLCNRVKPFTMTTPERVSALHESVRYVVRNRIPGSILECGVWKGGSVMACALTLLDTGDLRDIWMFDTFEGMSQPTDADRNLRGESAATLLSAEPRDTSHIWAVAPLDEVKRNVASTGYPPHLLNYVKGPVESTVPKQAPQRIALLRLDTDWYESTYHELVHLFPRLSPGGVLIIDDYGNWTGARKAVDQYFEEQSISPLLHRIDYTGRILVK